MTKKLNPYKTSIEISNGGRLNIDEEHQNFDPTYLSKVLDELIPEHKGELNRRLKDYRQRLEVLRQQD